MSRRIDLKGKRFGRLMVLEYADGDLWLCRCDCGKVSTRNGDRLRYGRTTSCGCLANGPRLGLTGKHFGKLTVKRIVGKLRRDRGETLWLCTCECGNETTLPVGKLTSGHTRSCGCLARVTGKDHPTFKHGHSGRHQSPEYNSWTAMHNRCTNPNQKAWKTYGGAGVKICKRWQGMRGFENFLLDIGRRPEGTTLGRFGDTGDYKPSNCKWMTWKEQGENKRNQLEARKRAA